MMNTRSALAATAALATAATLAVPAVASAAPVRTDVEREEGGLCRASSFWDLNLEKERGRIEIDVDIDTPTPGQRWKVKVTHNDRTVVNRTRVTDREGELDLTRWVTDRRGTDRVTFRAVNRSTGETCRGSLRI
jgi:hypothetical protein